MQVCERILVGLADQRGEDCRDLASLASSGQPAPATIRIIRGKQMVCRPVVVEARVPSGHVLRAVRESCQSIDGRVIYSQRP